MARKDTMTVYLEEDMKERFTKIMKDNGMTLTSGIELIIRNVLEGKIKIKLEIEND